MALRVEVEGVESHVRGSVSTPHLHLLLFDRRRQPLHHGDKVVDDGLEAGHAAHKLHAFLLQCLCALEGVGWGGGGGKNKKMVDDRRGEIGYRR